jgi:hypothetical protein
VKRTLACAWMMLLQAQLAEATADDDARACVAASTRGRAARDAGHLVAARGELIACAGPACPASVSASCTEQLAELDRLIPSVVVRVFATGQGDLVDAHVTLDGAAITLDGRAVRLDPGSHQLVVAAAGWLPVRRGFVIAEGEQTVLLDVQLPRRMAPAR